MRISANRKLNVFLVLSGMLLVLLLSLSGSFAQSARTINPPTFYRDVLPILELHCQSCHRAGGIAPMPFETYEETRPFAGAIARATQDKSMPPWFADPKVGQFSNDPSLKPAEIRTLAAWADAKSPAGSAKGLPLSRSWTEGWSIPKPDLILKIAAALIGRTATSCSCMPRGVRRMRGPKQWRNSSLLAPSSFFKCTTPP